MGSLKVKSQLGSALRKFHDDEGGMEAIEAVVTLAIAAVILCGIFYLWNKADVNGEDGLLGATTNFLGELFKKGTKVVTNWLK